MLECIPILGKLVSCAICVLLALTKGWVLAIIVLAYFIIMHILKGDVVGPRIVGKSIGLHPVVSLAALVAGGELFGIWDALFASPVAGVILPGDLLHVVVSRSVVEYSHQQRCS